MMAPQREKVKVRIKNQANAKREEERVAEPTDIQKLVEMLVILAVGR
jgi:hypothetical protein